MTSARSLLAMLAGGGIMVLAQVAGWSPEGRFEVLFAGFTAAAAVIAVSLTLYDWRQGRRHPEARQE